MAEWTTKEIVKSKQFLDTTSTELDTAIEQCIKDVTAAMIDYIDDEDLDAAAPGDVLKFACAQQVAYEIKRRKDQGLSSVTYQDGSINKFSVDEYLPSVKLKLNRKVVYTV